MKSAVRPELNEHISISDFTEFYWLKEELASFCKERGLRASGNKKELSNRIINYLETGSVMERVQADTVKTVSKFDWNHAALTPQTIITDNYKNSEQVRAFFTEQIGAHFRFNTPFMKWMKANTGKTLADAVTEWEQIHEIKKDKSYRAEIAPQFEYNRYIRDFMADNPGKLLKDAIHFWSLKKNQRGDNYYSKSDLELK